ncbi:Asparagine synthetase [glutamine-hydrolyzing] 3 [BD1-7 clade bacterium]|uniref:asparagine synthase (glutamine-hydrolyzing) n=1 Tax=BD1-7 clade bacterium TaxID=2029982 RepID=A0A5S9QEF2_9GAMM|nr:Asparagine synthetase [glutamine-hydrolyzing] 3 [BD1-7 clade bacterium]
MSTIHVSWKDTNTDVKATLDRMLAASDYWQPDAVSHWHSDAQQLGLGKALLKNTPINNDDAVYATADAQLAITTNARIDNRESLRQQLPAELLLDKPSGDSALILACYQHWGNDCVKHLRGDFVFAIWDGQKNKLFCGRDHFGVKTLFYAHTEQGWMLSNEHNAFFTSGGCDRKNVSEQWLVDSLWGVVSPTFQSPNPNIRVLPPAHTLEITAEGSKLNRYWTLTPKAQWKDLDDEALIDELKKRFTQSVVARTDTSYPIAGELSEGLDSNGIAGYAAQAITPKTLYTYSYQSVKLTEETQSTWAATYADIFGMLDLHDNIDGQWHDSDTIKRLDNSAQKQQFNQNFGSLNTLDFGFDRCVLAQQKQIRTMLSGWGGDHCVTAPGYEYARELAAKGQLVQLGQFQQQRYRSDHRYHPLKGFATALLSQWAPGYLFTMKLKGQSLENTLHKRMQLHYVKPIWQQKYGLRAKTENFIRNYGRSTVQGYEQRELFEIGVTNRLTQSELCARQCRIEYRFPMLDVDLVEFAHSLPARLKIKDGVERYPFRRILEGITTPKIQWRRKADVDFPVHDNTENDRPTDLPEQALCNTYIDREILEIYSKHSRTPMKELDLLRQLDDYELVT